MFKRWWLRRKMYRAAKRHDWDTALSLAKQTGDTELRRLFAMNRAIQILLEVEHGD